MKTSTAIFEADPEGWRAQNSDRPAAHLVRELVQNALDENGVTSLDVTVTYHGPRKGTTVVVVDNAPEGVRDLKLLFTLWLSDKEDSPTKRGRMGRGLKELVSVADETVIRTCAQDALVFERFQGGRWERKIKPKLGRTVAGTEVTAFVRGWGEKAAKGIVDFLRRVRAPSAITMRVGYLGPEGPRKCEDVGCYEGRQVDGAPCPCCMGTGRISPLTIVTPFAATEKYTMHLYTVMFDAENGERKERERYRATEVQCFTPPPGEKAYVYEMGIPVEACESPVSIDVQQRVVLRERRDTLTEAYKRDLFSKVLSARIALLTDDDFTSNATLIAAQGYGLSTEAKLKIAKAFTAGLPYAADPKAFSHATGHHIECLTLRSLPEAVRSIVREVGVDVKTVLEARKHEFNPQVTDLTDDQRRLIAVWEWIAKNINRPCSVVVRNGAVAKADFERSARVMSLYTGGGCTKAFFADPFGADQLGTFIHELSHWELRENEHGSEFNADTEDVGGLVASFLFNNAPQARLMLKANAPEVMAKAIDEVTP